MQNDARLVPYPNQQAYAEAIAREPATLLALPMGMGKTLIAVEADQIMTAYTTLIIAPKNTFRTWKRMYWRQQLRTLGIINSTKSGKLEMENLLKGMTGTYIMSWEFFRTRPMGTFSKMPELDLIVLDEVHRAQNRKGKTFKQMQTLKAKHKLAMSGTPNGNKLEGFWTTLRWLWPDVTPRSFWRWAHQWLIVTVNPVLGFTQVSGEKNPGTLLESQPHYIYEEDTKQYSIAEKEIEVPLLPVQRKLYNQLKKDMLIWLKGNPLAIDFPVHMKQRLRSIALGVPVVREDGKVSFDEDTESSTIEALLDFMEDLPENEPVLMLTHDRDFALVTAIRLSREGYPARAWVGGVKQADRDDMVNDWGKGTQIIVATIPAIAEGTDGLQDKCHTEVWISEDNNKMLNNQAAKRLPRDGQKHTVTRVRIVHPETTDRKMIDDRIQHELDLRQTLRAKGSTYE